MDFQWYTLDTKELLSMKKYIQPALAANAATLGVHWIYDHQWLKNQAKTQSLLFKVQSKTDYEEANPSYFAYPNSHLGNVTVQGEMILWLYQAMKQNPTFSVIDYGHLVFNQFRPGGDYRGYVESYAKKHVVSMLSKELNLTVEPYPRNDDHLVGFVPYIVCKELGLSNEKAFELTQLYSNDRSYYDFFKLFDHILNHLHLGLKQAVESSLPLSPALYQEALKQAFLMTDTERFIETYAGRACAIRMSIPVVIHLLSHHQNFDDTIQANILIGGAIADRAMLLGMIYHQVEPLKAIYLDKVSIE
jgi:hypothetical protein